MYSGRMHTGKSKWVHIVQFINFFVLEYNRLEWLLRIYCAWRGGGIYLNSLVFQPIWWQSKNTVFFCMCHYAFERQSLNSRPTIKRLWVFNIWIEELRGNMFNKMLKRISELLKLIYFESWGRPTQTRTSMLGYIKKIRQLAKLRLKCRCSLHTKPLPVSSTWYCL